MQSGLAIWQSISAIIRHVISSEFVALLILCARLAGKSAEGKRCRAAAAASYERLIAERRRLGCARPIQLLTDVNLHQSSIVVRLGWHPTEAHRAIHGAPLGRRKCGKIEERAKLPLTLAK